MTVIETTGASAVLCGCLPPGVRIFDADPNLGLTTASKSVVKFKQQRTRGIAISTLDGMTAKTA